MAKAKQFIGESYTDSAGQQWRWDGKKYIRNYGTSPMASIKRSWNQKIVPAAEQYAERQTRLTKEALNQKTPNINEYFNSILQERWDSAVTEDDKASVRDLLAAFNVKEEKDIIQNETGAAPTSVIPESFSEYRRRTRTEDEATAGGKVQETIQSGVIETEENPPPLPPITDIEPQYSADPNDKNFKGILSPLEAEGEIDLAAQARRRSLFEKNRIKDEDRYG